MMTENEMTAPALPAESGVAQPDSTNTAMLSEQEDGFDDSDEYWAELQRQQLCAICPDYLPTFTMNDLYERVYTHKPPLIEGLLYTGTYLFVGAPKLGKSFFMAQLAYHISTGTALWNYPVRQGTVLYLALEDDHRRLQERLYRMFGTEGTDKLFFSITAHQIGKGLDEQLCEFVRTHPDTSLIIIDTLQKVREMGGDSCSYANDYDVISKLKRFADARGLCLLLVHHTRKQQAEDKFDMISGTNGLLGAADGAFLLHKENRTSNAAVLLISGRDQQDQKLYLVRDSQKLSWNLERAEAELWKEPPEPLLEEIAKWITADNPEWKGSPTELVHQLGLDMPANALTYKLNVNANRLYYEHCIRYVSKRTHSGRRIWFSYEPGRDDA
jgi:RecA-family ATPase